MMPNTTVKATHRPIAAVVNRGTATTRSATKVSGGASVRTVKLATRSLRAVSSPEASAVPVASPEEAASPSDRSPTAPTGEYIVTTTRR